MLFVVLAVAGCLLFVVCLLFVDVARGCSFSWCCVLLFVTCCALCVDCCLLLGVWCLLWFIAACFCCPLPMFVVCCVLLFVVAVVAVVGFVLLVVCC